MLKDSKLVTLWLNMLKHTQIILLVPFFSSSLKVKEIVLSEIVQVGVQISVSPPNPLSYCNGNTTSIYEFVDK